MIQRDGVLRFPSACRAVSKAAALVVAGVIITHRFCDYCSEEESNLIILGLNLVIFLYFEGLDGLDFWKFLIENYAFFDWNRLVDITRVNKMLIEKLMTLDNIVEVIL